MSAVCLILNMQLPDCTSNPVRSVRVTDERDVMREMRELAARANAMHKEGLTGWHERVEGGPRRGPHPGTEAACRAITPSSQIASHAREFRETGAVEKIPLNSNRRGMTALKWEELNALYDEVTKEADPKFRLPFNQDNLEIYERLIAKHPEWGMRIVKAP